MQARRIEIHGIPSIVWGEPSSKAYVYVHGKMANKECAAQFAQLAENKGYQTLSFDLPEHGERCDPRYRCDVWNGMTDLSHIAQYAFSQWSDLSLFACSLGAYFCLNTYAAKPFEKCLFQSPIVDMKYLIEQMFQWFNVDEEKLRIAKEIPTPVDPLRWDYYQYVLAHPIQQWNIPTAILYGGKDNLQSAEVLQSFANAHSCQLTISANSEHPFMQPEDAPILTQWLKDQL